MTGIYIQFNLIRLGNKNFATGVKSHISDETVDANSKSLIFYDLSHKSQKYRSSTDYRG